VAGSGDNMWFAKDAFHYVWTKAVKDVSLTADVSFPAPEIDVLGRFLGGQGTINVPCCSPDSRQIAFVTYQLVA
jgi:hypothetical protein